MPYDQIWDEGRGGKGFISRQCNIKQSAGVIFCSDIFVRMDGPHKSSLLVCSLDETACTMNSVKKCPITTRNEVQVAVSQNCLAAETQLTPIEIAQQGGRRN